MTMEMYSSLKTGYREICFLLIVISASESAVLPEKGNNQRTQEHSLLDNSRKTKVIHNNCRSTKCETYDNMEFKNLKSMLYDFFLKPSSSNGKEKYNEISTMSKKSSDRYKAKDLVKEEMQDNRFISSLFTKNRDDVIHHRDSKLDGNSSNLVPKEITFSGKSRSRKPKILIIPDCSVGNKNCSKCQDTSPLCHYMYSEERCVYYNSTHASELYECGERWYPMDQHEMFFTVVVTLLIVSLSIAGFLIWFRFAKVVEEAEAMPEEDLTELMAAVQAVRKKRMRTARSGGHIQDTPPGQPVNNSTSERYRKSI